MGYQSHMFKANLHSIWAHFLPELLHQELGYSSPESAHESSEHLVKLDSWIVILLKS